MTTDFTPTSDYIHSTSPQASCGSSRDIGPVQKDSHGYVCSVLNVKSQSVNNANHNVDDAIVPRGGVTAIKGK